MEGSSSSLILIGVAAPHMLPIMLANIECTECTKFTSFIMLAQNTQNAQAMQYASLVALLSCS